MLFISNLYSSLLVTKLFGEARRLKIGKPKKELKEITDIKIIIRDLKMKGFEGKW